MAEPHEPVGSAPAVDAPVAHEPAGNAPVVGMSLVVGGPWTRGAREQAARGAKRLPAGLGPEQVTLGRTGEFVLSMASNPDPVA